MIYFVQCLVTLAKNATPLISVITPWSQKRCNAFIRMISLNFGAKNRMYAYLSVQDSCANKLSRDFLHYWIGATIQRYRDVYQADNNSGVQVLQGSSGYGAIQFET
jgi:hypothetical protein